MTKHRDNLMTAMEDMKMENEQLREEVRLLKEEINKLTLDKRYIKNIKENMRKLLGEE